jgi:hypothetical protein
MFDFKVGEKTVPLNWGTWSMKRFCEIKGITIVEYFDIIGSGNIQLTDVIAILQAAAEHGTKGSVKFTEFEVCEWIDADGGIVNPDGQIKGFFEWIAASHLVDVKQDEEKKSPNEVSV